MRFPYKQNFSVFDLIKFFVGAKHAQQTYSHKTAIFFNSGTTNKTVLYKTIQFRFSYIKYFI